MGKVDAFAFPGLYLWFNSNDHREPHIHIKRSGAWEIRAFLNETCGTALSYEVKFGSQPSGRVKRDLAGLVVQHRRQLLTEWEQKVLVREDQ